MGGRIRTVKPELFLHEGLFDAEEETGLPLRLCFIGLFTQADREGRFRWQPRRLKAQILPYDEDVDFDRVLVALESRGFIVRYTIGTREDREALTQRQEESGAPDPLTLGEFGAIPTFSIHQSINNKERDSEIPPPPASLEGGGASTRGQRDEDAIESRGRAPLEVLKGNKEQGTRNKEGNKEQGTGTPSADYPSAFELFWSAYPKKVGKRKALQRYEEARKVLRKRGESDPDGFLLSAVERWSARADTSEPRFLPNPETWLNQGRYDDPEPEEPKQKGGSVRW